MKTAIYIGLIVLAAGVGIAFWRRSKRTVIKSFWDALRNPKYVLARESIEESASKISGNAAAIRRLVDYVVFEAKSSSDAWTEMRILAKLGKEPYPRALEILQDPANRQRLVATTEKEGSREEAPICRLSEIFDNDASLPSEASGLLAPFLRSESSQIRKRVASVIGGTGDPTWIPDLRRVLKDEDDYVRSSALRGIQSAINKGRISPSDVGLFYEMVAEMWPGDTSFTVGDQIPQILLRLDRERAVARLLEPDLLTARFRPVWRILETFVEESVLVPRTELLRLMDEAKEEPIEYPMGDVMEGALALLGRHRVEGDLAALERWADHQNDAVSRGAAKGLYAYHRFFDSIREPWDVVEREGWDALTEAEKHVCAIEDLDGQVNNGGFAQYYFNSTGDHWRDAFNGLAAIGATKRHQAMAATILKFGRSEPASTRDKRNAQLAKVVRRKEDPFTDQDTLWYDEKDEFLDRLIMRYNLANPQGRRKPAE